MKEDFFGQPSCRSRQITHYMEKSDLRKLPPDAISTLRSTLNIISLAQSATELIHNGMPYSISASSHSSRLIIK